MSKLGFRLVAILSAILAFVYVRVIWPLPPNVPAELTVFFSWTAAVESILFGLGAAFLIYGVLNRPRGWKMLDWAAFVSIAWILLSGYPHDNMHIASGGDIYGLVPIEILFHGSLAIAAVIVAYYFVEKIRGKR